MALQSHKLKGFDDMDFSGKMRFFSDKPRRYKFWFINIHLYRTPVALGLGAIFGKQIRKNKCWYLTWEEWEERIKKVCPFQFWLRKTFIGGINAFFEYQLPRYTIQPYRRLKKRLKGADNVIKIKDVDIYADESTMILHSLFHLLCRYVESKPQDTIVMDDTMEQAMWWESVQKYYKYWKEERPQLNKQLENSYPDWSKLDADTPYEVAYADLNRIEKLIRDKDTEALMFIVDTRENFWI